MANSDLYLMHHGIRGMKWGVRRYQDENGQLTPAGKRRYAIQDARKYYKINRLQRYREKTKNKTVKKLLDGELRRTQTRSDRKHSDLSKKDINAGREIVAKNRLNWAGYNTAAKAALTAAGAAYLYSNPKTRALAPLAVAAGGAWTAKSAKKIPYYFMENRRYKQVNEKGSTTRGLTEKQKRLRKAAKVAIGVGATAAAVGLGAYAIKKYGSAKAKDQALSGMSDAVKAVYAANKKTSAKTARKVILDKVKSGAKTAGRRVGSAVVGGVKTGAKKATGYAYRKVTSGIDLDDPRTVVSGVRGGIATGRDIYDRISVLKNEGISGITNMALEAGMNKANEILEKHGRAGFHL